jgi:RNA polymerase sigma factor (sigma-70 family)
MSDLAVKTARAFWRKLRADGDSSITDAELLFRFAKMRDEKAFETLVVRHGKMVWGVCLRLLCHRQDAEDAFQATFLVLARKASSVGRYGLVANWLFGVARRTALCVRRYRSKRTNEEHLYAKVPDVMSAPATTWTEVGPILDEELSQLPSRYRLPLVLCCLEGMSHREAGHCLTWPTGTVAGRLSRGRELLRKRLRRRGIEVSSAVLTAGLAEGILSAAVPPSLVTMTVRSSVLAASARLTTVLVSPTVAGVVNQLLAKMLVVRLACLLGLGAILTISLASAGRWWSQSHPETITLPVLIASNPAPRALGPLSNQIELPQDPQTVVLRFARSDQNPAKPGFALTIRAGGDAELETSKLINGSAETKLFAGKLSDQELQDLFQFILHQEEFFAFDAGRVAQRLKDEYDYDGALPSPYDTANTEIQVQTAHQEHSVRWQQLASTAVFFPDAEQIQQLTEIEKRLSHVMAILKTGGTQQAQVVTDRVNAHLKQSYPRVWPLSLGDLSQTEDGNDPASMTYTYSRGDKYRGPAYFSVTLNVPKEGDPRIVSVIPGPSRGPPVQPRRPYPPSCLDDDFFDL